MPENALESHIKKLISAITFFNGPLMNIKKVKSF
jgi:hypothetical protein